jgi:hypothetical protein
VLTISVLAQVRSGARVYEKTRYFFKEDEVPSNYFQASKQAAPTPNSPQCPVVHIAFFGGPLHRNSGSCARCTLVLGHETHRRFVFVAAVHAEQDQLEGVQVVGAAGGSELPAAQSSCPPVACPTGFAEGLAQDAGPPLPSRDPLPEVAAGALSLGGGCAAPPVLGSSGSQAMQGQHVPAALAQAADEGQ